MKKKKKKTKRERDTGVISLQYIHTLTGKILASKVHFHVAEKALKSAGTHTNSSTKADIFSSEKD